MLLLSSMAKKHRLLSITSSSIVLTLILLLFTRLYVQAQTVSDGKDTTNSSNADKKPYFSSVNFSPSTAIVIVVIISSFFFLGFLSIYMRQCGEDRMEFVTATAAAIIGGRSRRQRRLDTSILQTFPTLVYSDVKEHKIGKGALECAICLSEFEDDDTISLLPKCDHVFHQECIQAWLAAHVTCPVCRVDYATVDSPTGNGGASTVAVASVEVAVAPAQNPPPTDHVAISVVNEEERNEDMKELTRIATRVRGNGSGRPRRLRRSHSTGHSMMMGRGEGFDRFTLLLPESVRKEIIASGIDVAGGAEGNSRKVGRLVGEGSGRRGRIMLLGRLDRWPSFSVRSLSARVPAWGSCRRSWEGSV